MEYEAARIKMLHKTIANTMETKENKSLLKEIEDIKNKNFRTEKYNT